MTNYINNREFEVLVSSFIVNRTPENELMLVSTLDLLIDNIIVSFNFDVDHEDAKQDCFLLAFKVLKNFNPEHGSAFNYFTTIIINNLRLVYTKKKVYNEKLAKYFQLKEHIKQLLED